MNLKQPLVLELIGLGICLFVGVVLMPMLIFYVGAAALGRYEGAALGHLYGSVFAGLREPSTAAWIVILGPYGLFVLFRALRAWWRASVKLAQNPP